MVTEIAVHVVSTGIQFVLGLMLLRRPREPVVAVLAHLFLINGVITLLYAVRAAGLDVPGISGRTHHQAAILEAATNILILWLALCYPRPVRWLPKWPAITAPLVAFGVAVLADVATQGGLRRLRGPMPLDLWDAFWVYGLFDLVFAVLLLRWTHEWLQPMQRAKREQFMLLFAVFGMRATHLSSLVPAVELGRMADRQLTLPALVFVSALGVVVLGTALVCLARILMASNRLSPKEDHAHLVLTVFLFIGVAEGMLNATIAAWGEMHWWRAITMRYDVMIARPGMVWLAFTQLHGGGLAAVRRNQFAIGSLGGLGVATILWISFPGTVVGGLIGGMAAGILLAAMTPRWLTTLSIWRPPAEAASPAPPPRVAPDA